MAEVLCKLHIKLHIGEDTGNAMKHMGPHWFDEKINEHPADPEFANFEKH
jgi:hypothetical protein